MTARSKDPASRVVPDAELLVRRHAQGAYQLAYRILQNHQDAMDCVQDAFVRALGSISRWRGDGSLRGWVLRIVANEAFRQRTGARRRVPIPSAARRVEEPPDAASRREAGRIVREAVAALAPAQRETLVLRHFGHLSLAEVAAARGCALGTVKATLSQAYKILARKLPQGVRPEA